MKRHDEATREGDPIGESMLATTRKALEAVATREPAIRRILKAAPTATPPQERAAGEERGPMEAGPDGRHRQPQTPPPTTAKHHRGVQRLRSNRPTPRVDQEAGQAWKEHCSDKAMMGYEAERETRLHMDAGPEGMQATVVQRYRHKEAE